MFPVCMFPVSGDRRRNSMSVDDDDLDHHHHHDLAGVEIRETQEEKILYESKYGSWRPGLETIVES